MSYVLVYILCLNIQLLNQTTRLEVPETITHRTSG